MRHPRAHKSRKKSRRATDFPTRIPDDIVDSAPTDFEIGCVACCQVYDDIYTVNLCHDHLWCINCVIDQFTAATTDIEKFPVTCCGKGRVLALQAVQYLLPPQVVQLYSTKLAEVTTEQKVWCSNKKCGEFLTKRCHRKIVRAAEDWHGTVHVGSLGHCRKCCQETFLNCSQPFSTLPHVCKTTTEMMVELPPYTHTEEAIAFRDRSRVTITLRRPGHKALSYESIDLGHKTWFELLDMNPEELRKLNGSSDRSWKAVHSRKYAHDPLYGFEAWGLDMYLENLIKENMVWQERQADRYLGETAMVRGAWEFVDDGVEDDDRSNI